MNKWAWRGAGAIAVVALIAAIGVVSFRGSDGDRAPDATAATRAALVGDWVEPVPGMAHEVQGFSLQADGSATSINMATLRYRRWRYDAGTLTLTGESIGNRTSSVFDDVYRVHATHQARLELVDDRGQARAFVRR